MVFRRKTATRSRKPPTRGIRKRTYKSKPTKITNKAIQNVVNKTLSKHIETKKSNFSSQDYIQIEHNSFISLDTNILSSTQGVTDPEVGAVNNRIGDQISLKGVSFKMMLELNERYSDVTYRILLIRSARGDVPTINTLWNGLSGNKMLDTFNSERYTIMFQQYGKIKAPNMSIGSVSAQDGTSTGVYYNSSIPAANLMSRATKIVKFYIPGTKFGSNGIIRYDANNGQVQKFFDYTLLVYAYSNYNTLAPTSITSGYNVLAVNDYIRQMYFKDA